MIKRLMAFLVEFLDFKKNKHLEKEMIIENSLIHRT